MNKGVKIAASAALGLIIVLGLITAFVMLGSKKSGSKTSIEQTSTVKDDSIKYTLKLDTAQFQPNINQDIKFSIYNQKNEVQKDFVIKDTKPAYVYFLRTDINKLLVAEPEFDPISGQFTIKNFNFGPDANYRMFLSFKAQQMRDTLFEQHEMIIKTDIAVGNKALYKVEAFGDVRASELVDGITANIDGWREGKGLNRTMSLNFNKGGTPFKDTKSFNGSPARIYAFKQGSMDFAFVNTEQIVRDPETGNIKFNILFPKDGIYKLFVELNINDKRQIGTFVVDVKNLK